MRVTMKQLESLCEAVNIKEGRPTEYATNGIPNKGRLSIYAAYGSYGVASEGGMNEFTLSTARECKAYLLGRLMAQNTRFYTAEDLTAAAWVRIAQSIIKTQNNVSDVRRLWFFEPDIYTDNDWIVDCLREHGHTVQCETCGMWHWERTESEAEMVSNRIHYPQWAAQYDDLSRCACSES